ncbi:MAG: hypothetical protein ABW104_16175 [Candidatus Thiodiazotropha sp. 6PLUC2]|nr:hypothetical protein [Candidatus Thiodiazotropha lotti]MCW4218785.1 hypothetical protein [Candidatus Thiodiazotropha lotti]
MDRILALFAIIIGFIALYRFAKFVLQQKYIQALNSHWNKEFTVNGINLVNPADSKILGDWKGSGVQGSPIRTRLFQTRKGNYGIFNFWFPLEGLPKSEVSMVSEVQAKAELLSRDRIQYIKLFGEPKHI